MTLFAADPQARAFFEELIGLAFAGMVLLLAFIFAIMVVNRLTSMVNLLQDIDSSIRFLRRLRYNRDSHKFELVE